MLGVQGPRCKGHYVFRELWVCPECRVQCRNVRGSDVIAAQRFEWPENVNLGGRSGKHGSSVLKISLVVCTLLLLLLL